MCAIVAPNMLEYPVALHAASVLGGVGHLIDPAQPLSSLAARLTGARLVVAAPMTLSTVREAFGGLVVVFGAADGATAFSELYKSTGYVPDVRIDCRQDVVVACSTVTGDVRLTHRQLVHAICRLEATEPIAEGEVVVSTLPFWHAYANTASLGLGVYRGASLVMLPRRAEPSAFFAAVKRHRATRAYVEGELLRAIAAGGRLGPRWPSLQLVLARVDPWDNQLAATCAEQLGCPVRAAGGGLFPEQLAPLVVPRQS